MIKLKSIFLYCLIGYTLLLYSCNHYYYAPNEGALMALNEKNDLKVSLAAGGADVGESSSFQVGYSPVKHLGLQTSYFSLDKTNTEASGDGYIFNGAVGAYYFFPKDGKVRQITNLRMQEGFTIDLYAGHAKGKVNNRYNEVTSSHFGFNKNFIQFGIHWQSRHFGLDFVLKNGILDFNKGTVIGKVSEEHLQEINDIEKYDAYDFREVAFRVHLGVRKARLFFSTTTFSSSKLENVKFLDRSAHVGVLFEIDEFFRKQEPVPKDGF